LAESSQYGPRGFKGRARCRLLNAASVGTMSDARENGDRGKERTDEALSARLQRLNEGLGQIRKPGRPSESSEAERAATASGYARGFRLSSELVAGVLVGAGLGWLIDRGFGTSPWGLMIFLLLGFAAGVLNVMRSAGVIAGNTIDARPPGNREQ
jgi:ATP synthase protein I